MERNDILPALRRPGMYVGEQGGRTLEEWFADAVVVYLTSEGVQMTENRAFEKFVERERVSTKSSLVRCIGERLGIPVFDVPACEMDPSELRGKPS